MPSLCVLQAALERRRNPVLIYIHAVTLGRTALPELRLQPTTVHAEPKKHDQPGQIDRHAISLVVGGEQDVRRPVLQAAPKR